MLELKLITTSSAFERASLGQESGQVQSEALRE